MWKDLLDFVPRPLVTAVLLYGGASWLITGPLVAERIAQLRYYPACVASRQAQPLPKSPEERLLDEFANAPLLRDLAMKSLGIDRYLDLALRQRQTQRESALATRPEPTVYCRCLIDKAIDKSSFGWALYAGSLRLIARPEVARFDGLMARIEREGGCHG
jgi:hypothetical protein